ncbi:ferrous iron transport protein A [Sulfurimonas sp. HSL-3221]|uniref:FeoA family protein n=1 Tax=Sulfurimonas diazotrophicus TaxID=3131939 RepID=A0ABZ3H838_9BACT|nr:FeoA family protein [Sulfurimonas sp. HSL-3221]UFS62141.1 ferrous iron transport protein A [Sulfurimonas sp. HSL-3221]
MKLTECMKGCSATIVKLHAQGPLKQRLVSFGVMKGARVELMGFAPAKSTVEIKIGRMRLALRKEEAELIEVTADA